MLKRSWDTACMAEGSASTSKQSNSAVFVTFSKRRRGLFKKAAELCKNCGAEVAVLVLSQSGNPFAFGHYSVDDVLSRYDLRRTTPNNTNSSLQITTTAANSGTSRGGSVSDKHRYQGQQVEKLKDRMKRAQSREASTLRELQVRIEKAWEACKTEEELESLKQECLALIEIVKTRLLRMSSSLSSGRGKALVGISTNYFTGEYLISGTRFDGKAVQANTLLGPADGYKYFDDEYFVTSTRFVGMAADSFFQCPGGGYSSNEDHVFRDVHGDPLPVMGSQNDLSYSLERSGHSYQQDKVLAGKASNYESGTTNNDPGTLVGLLDNYVLNQCLVSGEFGDQNGNRGIGMAGNNNSNFLPHLGESSAAGVFDCNVRPLPLVESFGNCAGSSYDEMVEVSDDEVFNYLGQLPRFYLNDVLASSIQVFDRTFETF